MKSGSRSAPSNVCSRLQQNGIYIDAIFKDNGTGACSGCSRISTEHFLGPNPFFSKEEQILHCMNREYESYCCLCLSRVDGGGMKFFGRLLHLHEGGCEQCKERNKYPSKMLAFLMASHPRLGKESCAKFVFEIVDGSNIFKNLAFDTIVPPTVTIPSPDEAKCAEQVQNITAGSGNDS